MEPYCHSASLRRLMRWKTGFLRRSSKSRLSVHTCCWEVPLLVDGLCAETARRVETLGDSGRESLESEGRLEARALWRLSELLEESEKETLWPGESKLPSEVEGRWNRWFMMIASGGRGRVGRGNCAIVHQLQVGRRQRLMTWNVVGN